jgi:Na+-driven multidrug efflux pump
MTSGVTFCMGLQSVMPQVYAAGKYKLVGAYLNRMLIIVTCIFGPIIFLMQFIEPFFLYVMK